MIILFFIWYTYNGDYMKRKTCIIIFTLLFLLFLIMFLTNNISGIDDFFYNLVIKLRSDQTTNFMKFITFLASTKFIISIVIGLLIFYFINKKKIFLGINILIMGEVLLNNIIKVIVGRERPSLEHLVTETSYSFPSGHTMVAVVLYGYIIYLIYKSKINKYIKIILITLLILLIILIMLSRIYLGVHFFSDVFAGLCLSLVYLIYMIDYLEKRELL